MIEHHPVLLEETIRYLRPRPNQNFIDATLGGGGHTRAILEKTAPQGKLICFDADPLAIERAENKLAKYRERIIFINDNFSKLKQKLNERNIHLQFSGLLADLGLSSNQLAVQSNRGFSFQDNRQLDMRLNPAQTLTAAEIVNSYRPEKLSQIFKEYGQEKLASPISQKISEIRKNKKIETTQELTEIILAVYRQKLGSKKKIPWTGKIHPATKVFQALRIAVNDELNNLKNFLPQAMEVLAPGGRLAVISFHSGEDKIVKEFFRQESRGCVCPPELPVCQCGHQPRLKIITKKPVKSSSEEIKNNPRSRSARLRVAEITENTENTQSTKSTRLSFPPRNAVRGKLQRESMSVSSDF